MRWISLFVAFIVSVEAFSGQTLRVPAREWTGDVSEVPGFPIVPKITYKILVPFQSEVGGVDFQFDLTQIKIEKAELPIASFPKPLCDIPDTHSANSNRALSEGFYPKSHLGPVRLIEKHGYRILYVTVYPARYHFESKRLFWVADGELRIELRLASDLAVDFLASEKDRSEALRLADDIGAEGTYPTPQKIMAASEYLIIGPKGFENDTDEFSIQRLMSDKNQRGITTKYLPIEDVLASEPGENIQEKVRNAVKRHYKNEGTRYLLLVGNGYSINPTKILTVNLSEGSIPSDLFFGCLDGDFKKKPFDMACEVAVGRAPASNLAELRTFVKKSLVLQSVATTDPIIWKTVNFGEKMDNASYASMSLKMLETGGTAGEGIITKGYPSSAQFVSLYETPQKIYTSAEVVENLSRMPFYTLNHLGHCETNYCFRLNEEMIPKIETSFPFFGITQGCFPGNMKRANWASKMVVGASAGAGALIANSNYGWYQPGGGDGPSNRLHTAFYDSVFSEGHRSLGKTLYRAKERLIEQATTNPYMEWVVYETNLFGDPEVQLKFPFTQFDTKLNESEQLP